MQEQMDQLADDIVKAQTDQQVELIEKKLKVLRDIQKQ